MPPLALPVSFTVSPADTASALIVEELVSAVVEDEEDDVLQTPLKDFVTTLPVPSLIRTLNS